jgi:hypothetical protein
MSMDSTSMTMGRLRSQKRTAMTTATTAAMSLTTRTRSQPSQLKRSRFQLLPCPKMKATTTAKNTRGSTAGRRKTAAASLLLLTALQARTAAASKVETPARACRLRVPRRSARVAGAT